MVGNYIPTMTTTTTTATTTTTHTTTTATRVRVDGSRGSSGRGVGREKFFEFSSKNTGFVHFYCEKLLVAINEDRRGLIDPLGAEDVKHKGLKI